MSKDLIVEASAAREKAKGVWDVYYAHHQPTGVDGTEAFGEIESRLRLLHAILDRVGVYHQLFLKQWDEQKRTEEALFNALFTDGRIYTESFYWQAGRVGNLLVTLPDLRSFKAPGVRNVRNKLIEHPEANDSKVLTNSFGWSPYFGPTIKMARIAGTEHVFPDAGLFKNAIEFFEALALRCERAIAVYGSTQSTSL